MYFLSVVILLALKNSNSVSQNKGCYLQHLLSPFTIHTKVRKILSSPTKATQYIITRLVEVKQFDLNPFTF